MGLLSVHRSPSLHGLAILGPQVFFCPAEDLLPIPISAGLAIFLGIAGLLSMVGLPLQSIFARYSRSVQSRDRGISFICIKGLPL
jgi:hypothetical protein